MLQNTRLEIWKTERYIIWLDSLFDTCFVTFVWIMNWKTFFWIYLTLVIITMIVKSIEVTRLKNKLK